MRFALILTILVALGSGCARVKPWQRENLTRAGMEGERPPGEERMEQHALGAREGADGGTGKAGGGCGCN